MTHQDKLAIAYKTRNKKKLLNNRLSKMACAVDQRQLCIKKIAVHQSFSLVG
jgi:hypothetical protein